MPDAGKLASLRQDIDQNSHRIKAVLAHPDVRKELFGDIPNDEKKAVKAFVSQNKEGALKTKPKVRFKVFLSRFAFLEKKKKKEKKKKNLSNVHYVLPQCYHTSRAYW